MDKLLKTPNTTNTVIVILAGVGDVTKVEVLSPCAHGGGLGRTPVEGSRKTTNCVLVLV